jgi:hypothetical protein
MACPLGNIALQQLRLTVPTQLLGFKSSPSSSLPLQRSNEQVQQQQLSVVLLTRAQLGAELVHCCCIR